MIEDEDIEIEDTQREDRHDLMMRLLMWREKHINEHNFVLILSFIIGICTAAAALILKFLIHFIQQLLTSHFNADSANIGGIGGLGMQALSLYYETEESKEGVAAYKEKRKPEFRKFYK